MYVGREVTPEPLDHAHHPGPAVGDAAGLSLRAIPALDGARGHGEDHDHEVVMEGQRHADGNRQREHPLSYAHVRQHEACPRIRELRHTAAEASRAEATALARERHHAAAATVAAREARGSVAEHAALQKRAQLVHREARHRRAGALAYREEVFEVLPHDAVQRRLLWVLRREVRVRRSGHAPAESKRRYARAAADSRGISVRGGVVAAPWRRHGSAPTPRRLRLRSGSRGAGRARTSLARAKLLRVIVSMLVFDLELIRIAD